MFSKTNGFSRRGQRLPEVLNAEEMNALLNQPNCRTLLGLRNRCLLTVMLDAGLRASETLNLSVYDLDWTSGKLTVKQGKGKKDRILWLNELALNLLKNWRAVRRIENGLLFRTKRNHPIYSQYLRVMVKRYGRKAEIPKDIHPHTLRHTFATDLYRATKNIRLVQKALGHADLSTTMIYTHLVDEELEEALKTFRVA